MDFSDGLLVWASELADTPATPLSSAGGESRTPRRGQGAQARKLV